MQHVRVDAAANSDSCQEESQHTCPGKKDRNWLDTKDHLPHSEADERGPEEESLPDSQAAEGEYPGAGPGECQVDPVALQGQNEVALKEDGREASLQPEDEGPDAALCYGVSRLGDGAMEGRDVLR